MLMHLGKVLPLGPDRLLWDSVARQRVSGNRGGALPLPWWTGLCVRLGRSTMGWELSALTGRKRGRRFAGCTW